MNLFKTTITKAVAVAMLLVAGAAHGQQTYNLGRFEGIKSEGTLPADLRLSLPELYSLDKQRVRDYNDGHLRNRDKVLSASYQINRTMSSGRILYGDPITRMVERIADTLLKDYPNLRRELRFYTLKSPDVNAFATGQGMVFVCTGLVAQVEDEAQLAFIISHEIVHYLRKHSLEEISRRKRDSDDIDAETQEMRDFIKYHNRSREMESEADSLGLTMFYLSSPYAKDVTEGVFDVLQYGYLPFDEQVFDTAYFNTPYFKMPSDYFMNEVDPITARDDYNDSLSTHPNILKRRTATSSIIGSAKGGKRFVTMSQGEFEQVRTLARFECVRQDIIYAEYVRGFYDCYLLQKLYPDNHYVELALCQSLYGLSKYKTYTNTSSVVGDYKDFEGEVQQCYYFFRRIKKDDLALVTARRLWQAHCRYPDDSQIAGMMDDIFADLFVKYNWKADFFSSKPKVETDADTVDANLSKYERLKQKKNRQRNEDMHAYAFTDLLMGDSRFADYLTQHLKARESKAQSGDGQKNYKNQLVYCPTYYVVNKSEGVLDILKSERCESALYSDIRRAAARNGIGSVDFSDQALHNIDDADRYNEWVDLNEWIGEFWQTKGDFDMQFSIQPQMERIVRKYDAGTINMSIVLNRENLVGRSAPNSIFFVWALPFTPFIINNWVAHSEATLVYSIQIDALSGHSLSKHTATYNLKDESARVRSSLYDHFLHIDSDTLTRTPGYLGSRLSFSLSPSLGLGAIDRLVGSGMEGQSSLHYLPVSLGLTADAGYVVSRRGAIHLGATYLPLSIIHDNTVYDVNNLMLSLVWRNYFSIAPLGYYWQAGADVNLVRLPQSPDQYNVNSTMYGMHLQFGRTHIFHDHLIFGYFVRYGLLLGGELFKDSNANMARQQSFMSNMLRFGLTIGLQP